MAWYDTDWLYRIPLVIDADQVSATLTNFPVLVSVTSTDLRDNAQSDGDDILFTSSDGTTKLAHEIEKYTSASGLLVAWVKIPSLSGSADTTIYMYFGNSGASNQESVTAVWSNGFVGVWHLAEDPSGSSPQMLNSVTNTNDGTSAGTMTSGDLVSAQIGDGLDFDGSDDAIAGSLGTVAMGNTMSAWLRLSEVLANKAVFAHDSGVNDGQGFWVDNDTLRFTLGGVAHYTLTGLSTLSANTWYHVHIVNTGNNGNVIGYLNGSPGNTVAIGTRNGTPNAFSIGASNFTSNFVHIIDEMRFATAQRDADWISTEFNNQNDPATFMTVGALEINGGNIARTMPAGWLRR